MEVDQHDSIKDFDVLEDDIYYSILPTSTQYSRNSLFSGLFPFEIQKRFPDYGKMIQDEGGKNMFEELFLSDNLNRLKNFIKILLYKNYKYRFWEKGYF